MNKMAGCSGWITIKIFELLFATFCMIYKRVTDDEASKLFYFLQKYSREWPLLNSITWEENGAIFTDITYGGYIIIIIGLIIGQCSGELQRCKKTENFFLITGALLFIAAGSLELAALESVEERLVDNAAILGVFSLLTGFLFIIDFLFANKRRKKEKLQIIQKYTLSKPTQTEENTSSALTKTTYLNGNIQNGKAHPVGDSQNGSRIPRNAVKILPSSPIVSENALTPTAQGFNEFGGAVYPTELPVIDGSEIKTHEGRIKSTESFLRSEKGFYPKLQRTLESDQFINNFFIPAGYVLYPNNQIQKKSKSKSDSGVGDSPTPPGYAKIIPDSKGKPGYVIIPIDQKDASRKVQSPATSRGSPEFYYLDAQDGNVRSPNLYRSASIMNSSDLSDMEEPIKQQLQKLSVKSTDANHKGRKFLLQSGDLSDEQKMSYPDEIHFKSEPKHSSRSFQEAKNWRNYPKGAINAGYLGDKENDPGFAFKNTSFHSRASSPEKPKSILRFDYGKSPKKDIELHLPKDPRYDSLDSQRIAEELKHLREITKSDLDLNLEEENKFLKEQLTVEKKEKEKLKYELEGRKKLLNESEEEKNRRISEREEQYFGIKDLKQSHKEDAQKERKGAVEVNEKLKQKYLEHESRAAGEEQEFRDLIDERFHFLHEEDKKRKNVSSKFRRNSVGRSGLSAVHSSPDLTSHTMSSKSQKSDSDETNSSQSADDEIKLRVETPGSYKSEALFWLRNDRESQSKGSSPATPGSPGYVLYTAQNWPESPSPESRLQFSAKEAQQLTLGTRPKTPVPERFSPEKNKSQKVHLLEFEEVPESTEKPTSPRKGLLVRKVDFPKEPVEVKKPAVVQGSTSTWKRWLYPKPKLQHTRSIPN